MKFSEGRDLLVIPKRLQTEVIKNAHDKGLFSIKKMEEAVKQEYYIPKLEKKITRIINNYVKCIIINKKTGKREGLLHPLFKENLPLHTYHMDHVGPLESTHKGYQYLLVVMVSKFT